MLLFAVCGSLSNDYWFLCGHCWLSAVAHCVLVVCNWLLFDGCCLMCLGLLVVWCLCVAVCCLMFVVC